MLSDTHAATELEALFLSIRWNKLELLSLQRTCFHLNLILKPFWLRDSWRSSCPLAMFLTYFNAMHGTWFTHWLEEGSFTLRSDSPSDSQCYALRYWITRLKTILLSMRSLKQGESKKGIKVFKSNFNKVLKKCSFRTNDHFLQENDFYLSRPMTLDNCR